MRRRRGFLLTAVPVAALLAALLFLLLRPHSRPGQGAAAPATSPVSVPGARPPSGLPLRLPDRAEARETRAAETPARFEGRVVSAATSAGIGGAEITFSRGGAADTVRSAPDWLLRALGLVSPMLGAAAEMTYQWKVPYVIDDRRFRAAFGVEPTSPEQAVAETAAASPLRNTADQSSPFTSCGRNIWGE